MQRKIKEKEADNAAHTGWWQTFEAVFGLPFMVAIALQFTVPLSLPQEFLTPVIMPLGVALIIVGLVLIIRARREFTKHTQPTDPGLATSKLITTGVFSFSRNPLYLGGIQVVMGIALTFDLPWVLISIVPSIAACYYILIKPEEKYLAETFGKKYRRYTMTVNRWLGRKGCAK